MKTDEAAPSAHRTAPPGNPVHLRIAWTIKRSQAAVALLAIVLLLRMGGSARAAQLLGIWGSTTAPDYLSGVIGVASGMRGPFFFGPTATPTSGPGLFEEVVMTPLDLGRRFVADESSDPDFNAITSLLTNGQNDFAGNSELSFPQGNGSSRPYSEFWFAHAAGGSGTWDFSGFRIESIAMHVERAVLTSPGSNPNADGNWTDYNFFRTLEFYGNAIPEPGSATLAAMGILWLAFQRRRVEPSASPSNHTRQTT